jgi:hypothetical protein
MSSSRSLLLSIRPKLTTFSSAPLVSLSRPFTPPTIKYCPRLRVSFLQPLAQSTLPFSTIARHQKGILPDSSDPTPPATEPHHDNSSNTGAAQISDGEYHEIADQYLDTLVLALEELSEKSTDGLEAEYSVSHTESTVASRVGVKLIFCVCG